MQREQERAGEEEKLAVQSHLRDQKGWSCVIFSTFLGILFLHGFRAKLCELHNIWHRVTGNA